MRLRLVQQVHRPSVCLEMRRPQHRVRVGPTGVGSVQCYSLLLVLHRELTPRDLVLRSQELDTEQPLDLPDEVLPVLLVSGMDLMAEIAEHLRRLTLSKKNVDPSRLPFRLHGSQA